jgi:hypothetical protein
MTPFYTSQCNKRNGISKFWYNYKWEELIKTLYLYQMEFFENDWKQLCSTYKNY